MSEKNRLVFVSQNGIRPDCVCRMNGAANVAFGGQFVEEVGDPLLAGCGSGMENLSH